MRGKKAIMADMMSWGILAGVILAMFTYAIANAASTTDFSRPIGQPAVNLVLLSQNAENALLYIDLAGKLSLLQSIYDVGVRGGYVETPACGDFGGFTAWKKGNLECVPDKTIIGDNLGILMNMHMDEHIAQYPYDVYIPPDNYDFSPHIEDSKVTLVGEARKHLELGSTDIVASTYVFVPAASEQEMLKNIHDEFLQTIIDEREFLSGFGIVDVEALPTNELVVALIATESAGDPNIISATGCAGLTQFCIGTARSMTNKYVEFGITLFPELTACACGKYKCKGDTPRCNSQNDDRIGMQNAPRSIRGTHLLIMENKKSFKQYTDSEDMATAAYNVGGRAVRCAIGKTGKADPRWAEVIARMDTDCIDISGLDTIEAERNKVVEVTNYVARIKGRKEFYKELAADWGGSSNGGEDDNIGRVDGPVDGPTGGVIYDLTGNAIMDITGRDTTNTDNSDDSSAEPAQETLRDSGAEANRDEPFGSVQLYYSVKPSFKVSIDYNFDIYQKFFDVAKVIEKRCEPDYAADCVYDEVIKLPETGAEFVRLQPEDFPDELKPDLDGPVEMSTGYDYVIRQYNDFLTKPASQEASEEAAWQEHCESDAERVVNDFVMFLQNCYYSESKRCYCDYPMNLMKELSNEYVIKIVEVFDVEVAEGEKAYNLYIDGKNELYNKQIIVPSNIFMPKEIVLKHKPRYATFVFEQDGEIKEITESYNVDWDDPDHIGDNFFLYKNADEKLTFAKKAKGAGFFTQPDLLRLITSLREYERSERDASLNTNELRFDTLEKCEPAPVLRTCVVDTNQKYLVYDKFTGETEFKHPAVKFSYFMTDDIPPEPLNYVEVFDAKHKEKSVVVVWANSSADDLAAYRLYYGEKNLDLFEKKSDAGVVKAQRLTHSGGLHDDDSVSKKDFNIELMPPSKLKGVLDLSDCDFHYSSGGCYYKLQQGDQTTDIPLRRNKLYLWEDSNTGNGFYIYLLTGIDDSKYYDFAVTAIDKHGNEIDNSEEGKRMLVVEGRSTDDNPPDIVDLTNLQANVAGNQITLTWETVTRNLDATRSDDVQGYFIYSNLVCSPLFPYPTPFSLEGFELEQAGAGQDMFAEASFEKNLAIPAVPCLVDDQPQPYLIHYVIIAADDNNNPAKDSFTAGKYNEWQNMGLGVVEIQVGVNGMLSSTPKIYQQIIERDIIPGTLCGDSGAGCFFTIPFSEDVEQDYQKLASDYGLRKLKNLNLDPWDIDDRYAYFPDFHDGIDIRLPEGSLVLAAADGIVEQICQAAGPVDPREICSGYGNNIILSHPDLELGTRYSHLQSIAEGLEEGQEVTQGQLIGYSGNTGYSTGAHLDFKVDDDDDEDDIWFNDMPGGNGQVIDPITLRTLPDVEWEVARQEADKNAYLSESEINPACYMPLESWHFEWPTCELCDYEAHLDFCMRYG